MYCEYCGNKLEKDELCNCPESQKARTELSKKAAEQKQEQKNKEKKKLPVKGIILIIVAIAIAIIAFAFIATKPGKIDLAVGFNEEIEVIGFNGHAAVDEDDIYNIDELEYAVEDYYDENSVEGQKSDAEIIKEMMDGTYEDTSGEEYTAMNEILESITFSYTVNGKEIDKLNTLSSGDELTIKVSSSLKKSKFYNVAFKEAEKTIVVPELEDGKELPLFKNLIVSWVGANGSGELYYSFKETSEEIEYLLNDITLTVADNGKLSNDDKVYVGFFGDFMYDDIDDLREYLYEEGYYLDKEYEEFTVSGLGELVTDANSLSKENLETLKKLAMKEINSSLFNSNYKFHKMYFGTTKKEYLKENPDIPKANLLIVTGSYGNDDDSIYTTASAYKLIVREDGTIVDANGDDINSIEFTHNSWESYTKEELNEIITHHEVYDLKEVSI